MVYDENGEPTENVTSAIADKSDSEVESWDETDVSKFFLCTPHS